MRWSIIRVIWLRELRDQLRDRRTVFMMAVLPLLLYPALGFGVIQFALSYVNKPSVVGIYGGEQLSARVSEVAETHHPLQATGVVLLPTTGGNGLDSMVLSLTLAELTRQADQPSRGAVARLPLAGWLAATPLGPASGLERWCGAVALLQANAILVDGVPVPLIVSGDGGPRFAQAFLELPRDAAQYRIRPLAWAGVGVAADGRLLPGHRDWLEAVDRAPLDGRQVDVLLIVPPDFRAQLEAEARPTVYIVSRDGDDRSRLVATRLQGILSRWKRAIKEMRFAQHGLPITFDDPVQVRDSEKAKSLERRAAEELFDILMRVFPFVLVMWSLAGALYPAVDLCAGEKERGTMETLLISPASRDEIVLGKFLAIWVFSAATALLNLASMGITSGFFSSQLPQTILGPTAILWSVLLVLPLSAFFSAICLAVGAYARSTKEGQYYLMPLFLLTMPLIFLSLAPGVELNPFYSLVPVTGVALLLQKLMAAASLDHVPWLYFLPVLAPMVLYSWMALRWAIEQFKREEVLFREAERLDIGLWIRHLLRDKEPLPTTGQALACFALIVALHGAALGLGGDQAFLGRSGVGLLAFVATPTLFMALLLTKQPGLALGLRPAPLRWFGVAALLAVLLLLPLSEVTLFILRRYPNVMDLLAEHNPLTAELKSLTHAETPAVGLGRALRYFLVLVALPAVAEELAFRGFILTGLRRRFGPWMAIVLSSFLFALYHFNVFQFVPAFVLGLVLGMLAVRTGSVLPGMLFHLLHNGLLIGLVLLQAAGAADAQVSGQGIVRLTLVFLSSSLAALVITRLMSQPFSQQTATAHEASSIPATLWRDAPTNGIAAAERVDAVP